jgi:phenylalanine-4-hydroxylase
MPDFRHPRSADLASNKYVVAQEFDSISESDHQIWRELYDRQFKVLQGRAADEWYEGMKALRIGTAGIPNYEEVSELLQARTGWSIVAVPGLVPDDVFFEHLANRRFPVTRWIRSREQMDYIVEPDAFHDCYGHVPHLADPFFADYLESYGRMGLEALRRDALANVARLYWYTVEFGLINTPEGLRIYGAGITSSEGESIYSLESRRSQRVQFDLERVMRSKYIIHTYQASYFVIDDYQELVDQTSGDNLLAMIEKLKEEQPADYDPWDKVEGDVSVAPNPTSAELAEAEAIAVAPTSYV